MLSPTKIRLLPTDLPEYFLDYLVWFCCTDSTPFDGSVAEVYIDAFVYDMSMSTLDRFYRFLPASLLHFLIDPPPSILALWYALSEHQLYFRRDAHVPNEVKKKWKLHDVLAMLGTNPDPSMYDPTYRLCYDILAKQYERAKQLC